MGEKIFGTPASRGGIKEPQNTIKDDTPKTNLKLPKIPTLDIQEGQVFPIVPHVCVLLSNAFCNIHLIGFAEFNLIIRNMTTQKYQIIEEFNWILIIQSSLHFRK